MSSTHKPIGVIDIFAGPGGLGEGFSSFKPTSENHPFKLAVSAEMEKSAHSTLRLRAFYRLLIRQEGQIPKDYYDYLEAAIKGKAQAPEVHFGEGKWQNLWRKADEESLNLTLGKAEDDKKLFARIEKVKKNYKEMILIGGPPCQAYSLVGRARKANVESFTKHGDQKHFLYKQYLTILARFSPSVFIMENVKGILTSRVGNKEMFSAIMKDLADPSAAMAPNEIKKNRSRYVLLPIHVDDNNPRTADLVANDPSAFIIRCENHGVAQARHRVIIMGVREDLMCDKIAKLPGLDTIKKISVEEALAGLPRLRSGLSRKPDNPTEWHSVMTAEKIRVLNILRKKHPDVAEELGRLNISSDLPRKSFQYTDKENEFVRTLKKPEQRIVLNHETRGHMQSDLGRYMFCSAFAIVHKKSPSSTDFPDRLSPDHANWKSGDFADRFRTQVKSKPSSTVTSHLSKDGHAFIHWDMNQCRSLTVREAARLQSFPDDYFFLGNRTQQYVQVGNAVPPIIARQIARVVWSILRKR